MRNERKKKDILEEVLVVELVVGGRDLLHLIVRCVSEDVDDSSLKNGKRERGREGERGGGRGREGWRKGGRISRESTEGEGEGGGGGGGRGRGRGRGVSATSSVPTPAIALCSCSAR